VTAGERMGNAAAKLRDAFDASFAALPVAGAAAVHDYLAIRVGGDPYAIRLGEIAGLHRDRRVVPVVCEAPEVLGIIGLRGAIVPVYDLRTLLGYPKGESGRWLVIAHAPSSAVAFAIDQFESHLRVSDAAEERAGMDDHASRHLRGAVRGGDVVRPLIDLSSVIEAITQRARESSAAKEP
jgi:chemotaxis signal transduction protein